MRTSRQTPHVFCFQGKTHRYRAGRLWQNVEKALREDFTAYGAPRGKLVRISRTDGDENYVSDGAYDVTFVHSTAVAYRFARRAAPGPTQDRRATCTPQPTAARGGRF